MLADLVMKLDLPLLEALLARFQTDLVERLNGVVDSIVNVDGLIDNAIGADTENICELILSSKNLSQSIGWLRSACWLWRCWWRREHSVRGWK